ncbi:hypothetical protein [Burkholderia gladioli]|uniref:hypothetical protein n=1 Tax=Burkholderia gladioli TaxID=28095 RepID=UPI0016401788|nr:hypothetical protein [Burkholderia gladioli]
MMVAKTPTRRELMALAAAQEIGRREGAEKLIRRFAAKFDLAKRTSYEKWLETVLFSIRGKSDREAASAEYSSTFEQQLSAFIWHGIAVRHRAKTAETLQQYRIETDDFKNVGRAWVRFRPAIVALYESLTLGDECSEGERAKAKRL